MIDPDRYFPPRPAPDRREPDSPAARTPAVAREELAGGCVLYRPIRFSKGHAGRDRRTGRGGASQGDRGRP